MVKVYWSHKRYIRWCPTGCGKKVFEFKKLYGVKAVYRCRKCLKKFTLKELKE